MTIQEVRPTRHPTAELDTALLALRTVEGTALFIDARASSQIVYFVETHHGSQAAAQVFTGFLAGCMHRITGSSVRECRPSGDAVLAIFTGPARVRDALDAAWRV